MPTLRVADATLYHEIRGSGPPLVLVGAPMYAAAFAPAADLLAVDHTVLTTDPRGIHRGRRSGRTPPRRTAPTTSPRC